MLVASHLVTCQGHNELERPVLIVPEEPDGETLPVSVVRVFDGDGFLAKVALPRRGSEFELAVRMGFIDAPEMDQPGGKEAREFLCGIIEHARLDLIILTKMDTGGSFDRHGRVVAVPYVRTCPLGSMTVPSTARSISRNVELEMIINGWAWVLERYCPDQSYFDALEDAQRNRRGIWARDDNVHPWQFKTQLYRSRRAKQTQRKPPSLFDDPNELQSCGVSGCTGHLLERQGKFGRFYGCSRFPQCRYARSERSR